MDEDRPVEDAEIEEIASPLASDERLRALIDRFEKRAALLGATDHADDEATDRHFAEIERVADSLAWRDDQCQLEQWDWAATFLTSERFRNLYPADRHWMFEDFIKDDITEFLSGEWAEHAATRMSKRELDNLLTVLSHYPMQGWHDEVERLEGILQA